jgi:hemolysin activation/secretion protein
MIQPAVVRRITLLLPMLPLLLLLLYVICRDPKVQDGPWSAVDTQLVKAAQQDAEQQARTSLTLPPAPTSSTSSAPAQQQQQQQQQHAAIDQAIDLKGFVLLGKTPQQLSALAEQLGQPKYRGKQILDSLLKGCRDVLELHGLPKEFREQLAQSGVVTGRSAVHHSVKAPDGTQKLLLQLQEGRVVETVGIPVTDQDGKQRLTVCVSSQVRVQRLPKLVCRVLICGVSGGL